MLGILWILATIASWVFLFFASLEQSVQSDPQLIIAAWAASIAQAGAGAFFVLKHYLPEIVEIRIEY